ncbi:unnamed protein product [Calypogeia fissa]
MTESRRLELTVLGHLNTYEELSLKPKQDMWLEVPWQMKEEGSLLLPKVEHFRFCCNDTQVPKPGKF